MKLKKSVLFCVIGLLLHYSFKSFSMEYKNSSPTLKEELLQSKTPVDIGTSDLLAGFGSVVGFGLGHAAKGYWKERGWVFTVLEGLAVAYLMDHLVSHNSTISKHQFSFYFFVCLKIFEIFDVITLYPQKSAKKRSAFQFSPLFAYQDRNDYDFGLSLNAKF